MTPRKKIYLIRHGETDINVSNLLQGSNVDVSLNETGKRQAQRFYEKYKSVPFKKIYTSTEKRSIESVQNFILDGIPHESYGELNEMSYGIYDGKISSIEENGLYKRLEKKWEMGNLTAKLELGENPIQVRERQERFIRRMIHKKEEDPILICMDDKAMQIFLTNAMHYNLSYMHYFKQDNMALYILNYSDHVYFMEKSNDTSHLDLKVTENILQRMAS